MTKVASRMAAVCAAAIAVATVAACGSSTSSTSASSTTSTSSSSSSAMSSSAMTSSEMSSSAMSSAATSGSGMSSAMTSGASSAMGSAGLTVTAGSLKGVCPDTVSLQTDWNPESEHGGLYELLGSNPSIDADKKRVSGELMAHGGVDTGIKFEVRSGGPAIGFQTVTSQLYADPTLTMGYVNTDEAIQLSAKQPTVAFFAPLDINPQMIMWDPAVYPDVKTIADLKAKNVKVRYFSGAAYMAYLTGAGVLDPAQTDGSYDGTPANFVAAAGKDAQQGFASAEPYLYEHQVKAWDKPVAFQLIHDAGYPIYAAAYSVRKADLEKMTPCLKLLTPIFQQAVVDYTADPKAADALILDLVKQYNTGWTYDQGEADYANKTMVDLKLVGNGTNKTIGDFDEARITKVLGIDTPIFTKQSPPPASGLTAKDLFTNEFIDTSIGLP